MDDRDSLRKRGFDGFLTVAQLRASRLREVPGQPGVYAFLRESKDSPVFLARSVGGHFKGKDPTVSVGTLERAWMPESDDSPVA